jgi:hypothetical protein
MAEKNLKVKIQRLWFKNEGGKVKVFASIRDYIVAKAMKEKKNLEIICERTRERMIIPYEKLHEGKENPEIFKSKYDGKEYKLIDFEWKSDKKLDLSDPKTFAKLIL